MLRNLLRPCLSRSIPLRLFSSIRDDHVRTVTLIPGDGVGPEIAHAVEHIVAATGAPIKFEEFNLSEVSYSSATLDEVVKNVRKNKVCLKGVLATTPHSETGEDNINVRFRKRLDLFASIVNIASIAGLHSRFQNLDMAIVRESTEGEYSCVEHESVPGVVESSKIVTKKNSMRIAKYAFDYAVKYNRKKVTAVHKANIMKDSDGLFLNWYGFGILVPGTKSLSSSCRDISKLYPSIEFNDMIIDNTCMQIVSNPRQFDVMVMPNLYGNILANLGAGLVGGAGVVAGSNVGHDCIVFEPGARHSYGEAAGKNIANPTAMVRASYQLLRHLRLYQPAKIIQRALKDVILQGKVKTKDMGGQARTSDFTKAIIAEMKAV